MSNKGINNKIVFLFGAGAESEFCSTGEDFANFVIGADSNDDINLIIKKHYNKILNNIRGEIPQNWYPRNFKLSEKGKNYYWELLKNKNFKESYEKTIENSKVTHIKMKLKYKGTPVETMKNASNGSNNYIGLLDAKFHTLICPALLGKSKFCDVINAYTRAYILISMGLRHINFDNSGYLEKIENMLEDPKGNYDYIIKSIESYTSSIQYNSYYSVIRKVFENNNLNIPRFITTNYTPIAEKIFYDANIKRSRIAKVHGSLEQFESPYYMQVIDINDKNFNKKYDSDMNFPYLFIQSALKPIVENRQIKEFGKMVNFLENSNVLIVIGYKFNLDDNHINSMIQNYLMKRGKKLVYFYYNGSGDELNSDEIKNRIKNKVRIPKHHKDIDNKIHIIELCNDQTKNYSILEKTLCSEIDSLQQKQNLNHIC